MMTDDSQIEVHAAALARAESALIEAEQAADQAAAHADLLRGRIASQAERLDQIRKDHSAGKVSDREAGGLAALATADRQDLEHLHHAAETDVQAARQAAEAARERRDLAQQALSRAASAIEFDALSRRIESIEGVLTSALAELFRLAVEAGKPRDIASVWKPTPALYRALVLRVPPTMEPAE